MAERAASLGPLDGAESRAEARLDYLLFEVVQSLPMPADLEEMRQFEVAESSAVRLASVLEEVQAEYLQPAIQTLFSVAQTSDLALRRELSRGRR